MPETIGSPAPRHYEQYEGHHRSDQTASDPYYQGRHASEAEPHSAYDGTEPGTSPVNAPTGEYPANFQGRTEAPYNTSSSQPATENTGAKTGTWDAINDEESNKRAAELWQKTGQPSFPYSSTPTQAEMTLRMMEVTGETKKVNEAVIAQLKRLAAADKSEFPDRSPIRTKVEETKDDSDEAPSAPKRRRNFGEALMRRLHLRTRPSPSRTR